MQDADDISIGIVGLGEWEIPPDQTGRGLILQTTRGPINTIVHRDPEKPAHRGVIWVGGARGGLDGPAGGLYKDLGKDLAPRITSLRIDYRDAGELAECVMDTLAGVSFLSGTGHTDILLVGHSFGGATSIHSAYSDSRIDACINLDGWMVVVPDSIINKGINQDFMYIGQEEWDKKLNYEKLNNFINSNNNSSKILIPETTHYDFSDTPHMSPVAKILKKSGKLNAENLKNVLNELIVSFFNENLKNMKKSINYYELSNKYEINMIVEEYSDQ